MAIYDQSATTAPQQQPYNPLSFHNLLLGGLLSFAPSLLSKLFGHDPAAEYRKQANKIIDPQNIARLQQQFYQQLQASPAFSQAQGNIALGANVAGNQLQNSLAARGIGTSGTGAVLSSLVPSLVGSQQAGLRTATYNSAQEQAMNNIQQQLAALQGRMPASTSSQLFGAGLDAFGPMLSDWLHSRRGNPPPQYGYR